MTHRTLASYIRQAAIGSELDKLHLCAIERVVQHSHYHVHLLSEEITLGNGTCIGLRPRLLRSFVLSPTKSHARYGGA